MVVLCKLSIYSVYDCLSVGQYVRLVGGFFITASKYLRDRTTRRMEDRPSKCEDVANTVSLISLGIYYYLYRLRKVRVALPHVPPISSPRFVTFCVILYHRGPIAHVNPKESNYNIQRIHTESIAK